MQSDGVSERSRDVDELDISLTAAVLGAFQNRISKLYNRTAHIRFHSSLIFFWFCVVGLVLGIILRRKALGEISPLSAPPSYRGPLKKRAAEEPQPRG